MSNLFKEALKFATLKVERVTSPLCDELDKQTKLNQKEIGRYGVLGTDKLLRNEEENENER